MSKSVPLSPALFMKCVLHSEADVLANERRSKDDEVPLKNL